MFDPNNVSSYPIPVPPPSSTKQQSFRVVYISVPDELTGLDDEPFTGKLKSYHTMLGYRVAYMLTGEARFQAEYVAVLKRARAANGRPAFPFKNALYNAMNVKGRR